ncbi:divergent polysaccharide deacetylase family protein [Roseomonas sp. E05]|uniref:divergent polysaccharide deacetylase family protein n=1 Tax=Roseomonas sp. E05 TaxID=3046310 RepID=UPI0024BBC8C1|nr:divergent polysaccharide deacetylase family protein [Roseomonas sp. E05]MDJ0386540.1 divergent polysaccharide deacetylase family protein [Roseomonas sp. E05]
MTGQRHARRAWRALGAFWALVAAGAVGTVLLLDGLGPPQPAPAAPPLMAEAPAALPAPEAATPPPPAEPAPPAVTPSAAIPPPAEMGLTPESGLTAAPLAPLPEPAAPPLAPPEAPPPPPLPAAAAGQDSATPIAPPDPALLESSPFGPLPHIGPEGREPRQAYARPFDAGDRRPRIALVVGGLGNSAARSAEAIRRLPPAVTLAFNPQGPRSDLLLEQARRRGMEVVLALPLEAAAAEPAEALLSAGLTWEQNRDRLFRALGRFAGYAGAVGALGGERGERFAAETDQLEALQAELRRRGLFYLDPRLHAPSPAAAWGATADLVLDEPLTRGELEHRLGLLERLAREQGSAVGLAGEPAPLLVDRIAAWAEGLAAEGLVLAPLSAVVQPPQDGGASAAVR